MRLAVVDHVGNFGGASRVVRGLLHGMAQARTDLRITYFCNPASLRREELRRELDALGIEVRVLSAVRLWAGGVAGIPSSEMALRTMQAVVFRRFGFLPPYLTGDVAREMAARLRGFDVAYFPWPYLMDCPRTPVPLVATFHDFNFKYFFGSLVHSRRQLAELEAQMPGWLAGVTPVVSSEFMRSELARFYPAAADRTRVIHLAPPSVVGTLDREAALRLLAPLGIRPPYALYPTNTSAHKNIGTLVAAIAHLRGQGVHLPLVLTGPETEAIVGRATRIGVERGTGEPDVRGLGYVSNDQIDALIQCATMVVTSSLYEAGNGPGVDAWGRAVPVAMSDIPPFTEHLRVQGVRARVFDPRSPEDIAAQLKAILDDPEGARADAEASRAALQKLTWRDCAGRYLEVFEAAAGGRA